jgi:hypothetical protein
MQGPKSRNPMLVHCVLRGLSWCSRRRFHLGYTKWCSRNGRDIQISRSSAAVLTQVRRICSRSKGLRSIIPPASKLAAYAKTGERNYGYPKSYDPQCGMEFLDSEFGVVAVILSSSTLLVGLMGRSSLKLFSLARMAAASSTLKAMKSSCDNPRRATSASRATRASSVS